MFYWITLWASAGMIGWIFGRRYWLMKKSLKFEEQMKREEERLENREEEPVLLENQSDLQLKRQAEQRAKEERSHRIKEAKKAFKQAEIHYTKGDYGLAEKHLLQVLSYDNDHLDANLKLGLIYLHQENLPRAEFFFQKLIDLKENPVYFSNLGLTLYQQNRLEEAAKIYERAIEMDNKRAARYVSLAHVYEELGGLEKAMSAFESATRLEPRNLDYWWKLIEYYEKFSRQEEQIRALKKVLELDPYNKEAQGKLLLIVEGPAGAEAVSEGVEEGANKEESIKKEE